MSLKRTLRRLKEDLSRSEYFRNTSERETLMGELCEHLRQTGIEATLLEPDSPEARVYPLFLGWVKIESRNIDMILVNRTTSSDSSQCNIIYGYYYVLWLDANTKLKAFSRPNWPGRCCLKRGFKRIDKSQIDRQIPSDFWYGGELAGSLVADSDLTYLLYSEGLDGLEITPDRRRRCVTIQHIHYWKVGGYGDSLPGDFNTSNVSSVGRKQFPTREAFEAYDRIAYTIRRTAMASSNSRPLSAKQI